MAAASGATSVGTSPTLITASYGGNDVRMIRNNETEVTVYFGGASVTTANGFPVGPGEVLIVPSGPTVLYGIVAEGTANVRGIG